MADLTELDDDGVRLRAQWKRTNNFFAAFARDYLPIRRALVADRYGRDWTPNRWALHHIGTSDYAILLLLQAHQWCLAGEDRDYINATIAERREELRRRRLAEKTRVFEHRDHLVTVERSYFTKKITGYAVVEKRSWYRLRTFPTKAEAIAWIDAGCPPDA
jgi:hypothetical protein